MALTTSILDPAYYRYMLARMKSCLAGLDKLSDADAAAYLTSHLADCACPGMATPVTADMVHEVRAAKI